MKRRGFLGRLVGAISAGVVAPMAAKATSPQENKFKKFQGIRDECRVSQMTVLSTAMIYDPSKHF
jgi:hypothetical protein